MVKFHRPQLIYFVQANGGRVDHLIKAGCSSDVPSRIKMIQRQYKTSIELLATGVTEGLDAFLLERYVHTCLSAALAHGREWFYPTSKVLRFAAQCAVDNEWLKDTYPHSAPDFATLLARESRACAADHAASDLAHFAYRQHERRAVYYPMRAASLKLANDITRAIVAPAKVLTFPSVTEVEKAA